MARKTLLAAIGTIIATSPVAAAQPEQDHWTGAPQASENARYCLKIEAITGSRLEEVICWTRQEWAAQDVDVDKEWAKEGVRVIG
jgi:hypothetical protein